MARHVAHCVDIKQTRCRNSGKSESRLSTGLLIGRLIDCLSLQVQLMSRDEQSVLVLTYAELKQCLFEAFNELSFNM